MSRESQIQLDDVMQKFREARAASDGWRESSAKAWKAASDRQLENARLRLCIYALLGAVVLHLVAFSFKVLG